VTNVAFAQTLSPASIVADKVEALIGTTPDATAHFTCELRPFNRSKGLFCYGPAAIRAAYGVDKLIAAGFDGTGQTIVIIDAFGSPTIDADLAAFDTLFGIPAPPSFQQIHMPGSTPFDPTNQDQVGWAGEIALDVQWSHAIAPGASIILVAAASDSFEDILAAQNYAIDNRLGSVISESFGASELGLGASADGLAIIAANEESYKRARNAKIGTFVSAGDNGVAGRFNGVIQRVPQYPATSTFVTTVGGTNLFFGSTTAANPNGTYQGELVWNDGFGAGGGGISSLFELPNFQQHLPKSSLATLSGHRGYPDIAYNAGVVGGVLVHDGVLAPSPTAFFLFGGTSAGAPQWAAVASIANQVAGHPLGLLNKRIYKLGRQGTLSTFLHDVTLGDNGFAGVTGFLAAPGWDLATGWGTPNVGFVQQLATDDDENDD
ncbi:MAG: S53 family peptidase, partial [Candidatus Angelobacter sp.]